MGINDFKIKYIRRDELSRIGIREVVFDEKAWKKGGSDDVLDEFAMVTRPSDVPSSRSAS